MWLQKFLAQLKHKGKLKKGREGVNERNPCRIYTVGDIGITIPGARAWDGGEIPPSAKLIFLAPQEEAGPGKIPPEAKVYIVGHGLAAWRLAVSKGLPAITPEKALALAGEITSQENSGDQAQPNFGSTRSTGKENKKGTIIVVYSSKTSVGKTSATANLGTMLAKEGKKVCLVDADPGGRTLTSLALGIATTGDIASPQKIPWGLDLVPSLPDSPALGITEAKNSIRKLAGDYDFILVDAPGRLELPLYTRAFLETAVETAGHIILMASCDHAAVAAVRAFVAGKMDELHIRPVTRLVVNQTQPLPPLKPQEVAKRVGLELTGIIPHDHLVDRMFAEGKPIPLMRLGRKGSAFLNALQELRTKGVC
ncbi:AAA family ATPase [Neomoorella mulderi]|uniref:Septum site-determining protein MinD n=1 Tax=Moorella mulderi DSM 14980 TaxID=1122241 RepID=A0A151AVC2_9FIRM|nr:AAA family ATPase [Moorella mulderi]KYH31551.1 septum site-determining protein MinD [Moorella mulderi DSM 14980]